VRGDRPSHGARVIPQFRNDVAIDLAVDFVKLAPALQLQPCRFEKSSLAQFLVQQISSVAIDLKRDNRSQA
jgi:hypothetical protein